MFVRMRRYIMPAGGGGGGGGRIQCTQKAPYSCHLPAAEGGIVNSWGNPVAPGAP